jgi:hypothetical protein
MLGLGWKATELNELAFRAWHETKYKVQRQAARLQMDACTLYPPRGWSVLGLGSGGTH